MFGKKVLMRISGRRINENEYTILAGKVSKERATWGTKGG
jgi:hypothetical protein